MLGGLLVQSRDRGIAGRDWMKVVCGEVVEAQWDDLLFALRIVKHVTSNAIVLARDGQTLGIGAGQMSRVDAVRIAVDKARESDTRSRVPCSRRMPSSRSWDALQLALAAGVTAIIQPGGSKRDDEVIDAVSATGAAMVFTDRRHFRH